MAPERLTLPPSVLDFVDTVRDYCALIEGHAEYDLPTFLFRVQELLPLLYYRGLLLPEVEVSEDWEPPSIEHSEWQNLYRELGGRLGGYEHYRELFNPYDQTGDPIVAGLADDLSEIWQDLKGDLLVWREDDPVAQADAVWHWRWGLEHHWGIHHLPDALKAITWLVFEERVGQPDD